MHINTQGSVMKGECDASDLAKSDTTRSHFLFVKQVKLLRTSMKPKEKEEASGLQIVGTYTRFSFFPGDSYACMHRDI